MKKGVSARDSGKKVDVKEIPRSMDSIKDKICFPKALKGFSNQKKL